ncbi:unnamed protein product [Ixodes hexagonus]
MLEKVVLFETDEAKSTKCTIHLNGILHQEKTVTSVSDAEGVLNCVDSSHSVLVLERPVSFLWTFMGLRNTSSGHGSSQIDAREWLTVMVDSHA